MKFCSIVLCYWLMFAPCVLAEKISLGTIAPDLHSADILVELDKNEGIVQESVTFATSDPALKIESWHTSATPESQFDKISNASRHVYTGPLTFNIAFQKTTTAPQDVTLFMHYAGTHHQFPQERKFTLTGTAASSETSQAGTSHHAAPPTARRHHKDGMPAANNAPSIVEQLYEYVHYVTAKAKIFLVSFKDSLSRTFSASSSRPFQIFIAFLLGVLMSLTPCIYPMIPITIGLLGASSSNSWMRNFLLASCYTVGMGATFALLGLVTVFFGAQCGALLCNPWFTATIVAFLAYCGGSMLGLYEFYTPRILQPSANHEKGSNFGSAFLFGMISGTFASPCMSPGLALILSAAATLGNHLLAFLLLFAFGIGASMPLLIIGTFSGALNFLPRAGMWMNDIKKAFGVLLIMMSFYYAQALISVVIAWSGAAIFALICGMLYTTRIRSVKTFVGASFITLVSTILIGIGLFSAYSGFMAWQAIRSAPQHDTAHWATNYAQAKAQALAEHKFVLADFTASWCPMCVLLDKQILQHPDVAPIFDAIVAVKVDGSSNQNAEYNELTRKFKIIGIPQLFLIDPASEEVIQVWSSELLGKPAAEFRDALLAKVQAGR